MLTTIAIYSAGIMSACGIAIIAIAVRANRDQTSHATTHQGATTDQTCQQGPAFLGMPQQRRPDYREEEISPYAERGITACEQFMHAHDTGGNQS